MLTKKVLLNAMKNGTKGNLFLSSSSSNTKEVIMIMEV